jgi:hypothetical protein
MGMLLWSVKSRDEVLVDLTSDVSLQTTNDLAGTEPLCSSTSRVLLSRFVMAEST